mmetsp:Transcript_26287/g.4562  ORF Transcript_26287/g.4562 Transcript_26287/m.4562 type:complete len:80 (+) Transcript_26287:1019-1258(+)|eukprot:CAMPEP_0168314946 /NCGR_PEP_ID=MMETSP0210-20121227/9755_1 /TAXON_ID=40633 /ORGANISM="Condylostoma magnum, Strain COL2" /LENGTH=79 /DNA_ID=CAMNT_0008285623 /DNA_START=1021 /DNA_END=1260 /DNA_ORIENTATION=-
MYMDLSFKNSHPINKEGKIEVTFNNVEMFDTSWKLNKSAAASVSKAYCYLNYQGFDIDCTATAGKVTLTLDGGAIGAET